MLRRCPGRIKARFCQNPLVHWFRSRLDIVSVVEAAKADRRSLGRACFLAGAMFLGNAGSFAAHAEDDAFYEIETKYLFGFTIGSGIGLEGEKEISAQTVGQFGKRDGTYDAWEHTLEFEYTPSQYVQIELEALAQSHFIRDVTGLDDRDQTKFSGFATEFRYLLLGRGPGEPVSITLSVEPEYSRVDDVSGERVRDMSFETRFALDAELIPNRLFAGFNLLYVPEILRTADFTWERATNLGILAALSYRLVPTVVVGAEVEYYRHYDALNLSAFEGDALYVGPTLYWQLTRKSFIQVAWSAQVAGHAVGEPGGLNLDEFSRYKAKLKYAYEF